MYVCHHSIQHNEIRNSLHLPFLEQPTYEHTKNWRAFAHLSAVSPGQMHLGKEQEPQVSFSSSSCRAHPSTKLPFEDSGSFVLGSAPQGNRARELKSIDTVCSCDCRMPSLTGVTFEWNLQSPLFVQVILKSISCSFSVAHPPFLTLDEKSPAQDQHTES